MSRTTVDRFVVIKKVDLLHFVCYVVIKKVDFMLIDCMFCRNKGGFGAAFLLWRDKI